MASAPLGPLRADPFDPSSPLFQLSQGVFQGPNAGFLSAQRNSFLASLLQTQFPALGPLSAGSGGGRSRRGSRARRPRGSGFKDFDRFTTEEQVLRAMSLGAISSSEATVVLRRLQREQKAREKQEQLGQERITKAEKAHRATVSLANVKSIDELGQLVAAGWISPAASTAWLKGRKGQAMQRQAQIDAITATRTPGTTVSGVDIPPDPRGDPSFAGTPKFEQEALLEQRETRFGMAGALEQSFGLQQLGVDLGVMRPDALAAATDRAEQAEQAAMANSGMQKDYSDRQKRELRKWSDALSQIKRDPTFNNQTKALALDEITREIEGIQQTMQNSKPPTVFEQLKVGGGYDLGNGNMAFDDGKGGIKTVKDDRFLSEKDRIKLLMGWEEDASTEVLKELNRLRVEGKEFSVEEEREFLAEGRGAAMERKMRVYQEFGGADLRAELPGDPRFEGPPTAEDLAGQEALAPVLGEGFFGGEAEPRKPVELPEVAAATARLQEIAAMGDLSALPPEVQAELRAEIQGLRQIIGGG